MRPGRRARAGQVALALALLVVAAPATAAPRLAAVAIRDSRDVRTAVLVGPSGEVYEPFADGWSRRIHGGIAADVTGALLHAGVLWATGKATPIYRRDGDSWRAARLGQRGRTLVGTGPAPSMAIGPHVFVMGVNGWVRLGQAPGPINALWSGGPRLAWVVVAGRVLQWRGNGFGPALRPVEATLLFGASPWAISGGGLERLGLPRRIVPQTPGTIVDAAQAGGSLWIVMAPTTGPWVLEKHPGANTQSPVEIVPTSIAAGTALAGFVADPSQRLLIATRDGAVHLWIDGAWRVITPNDAPIASKPGPGPAVTR